MRPRSDSRSTKIRDKTFCSAAIDWSSCEDLKGPRLKVGMAPFIATHPPGHRNSDI